MVALTKDLQLLVESLKDSTVVTVGEEGVRPNIKAERNTIILREISSATPEKRLEEIFTWEGCPTVKSIRKDVKDTW